MGMKVVIEGQYHLLRKAKGIVEGIPIEVSLDKDNGRRYGGHCVKINRTDGVYGYEYFPCGIRFFAERLFNRYLNEYDLKEA